MKSGLHWVCCLVLLLGWVSGCSKDPQPTTSTYKKPDPGKRIPKVDPPGTLSP